MTIEELYRDFGHNFPKIAKVRSNSDGLEWRMNICHYFCQKGADMGYKVFAKPSLVRKSEKDYLADVCWRNDALMDYCHYHGLELILESAWLVDRSEIIWNLCRLIDIKSLMKVMVICIPAEGAEDILQEVFSTIKSSLAKTKEEEYLVLIFTPVPTAQNPVKFTITGYRIGQEGKEQKLPAIDFAFA